MGHSVLRVTLAKDKRRSFDSAQDDGFFVYIEIRQTQVLRYAQDDGFFISWSERQRPGLCRAFAFERVARDQGRGTPQMRMGIRT
jgi:hypothetical protein